MGVQFLSGFNNFNSYSNYRKEIPRVSAEEVRLQDLNKASEINTDKSSVDAHDSVKDIERKARISSLEDISLTFNKDESFDYLQNDSSVKSLDMEKAISDMKKDDILQEYQYFVGNSKNLFESNDGVVIAKNK